MAFFKLPKKDKKSKSTGTTGVLHTTLIMHGLRKLSGKEAAQIPLIGHLPPEKQIAYTAIATLASVILTASLMGYSNYQVGRKADFVGTSTEMQMLSQRIAKGSQQAVLGNKEAFKQLKDGKIKFDTHLKRLTGDSPSSAQTILTDLNKQWGKMSKETASILTQQQSLEKLNQSVAEINAANVQMLELSQQVVSLMVQAGIPQRDVSIASDQVMLTQRMAKNANNLLSSDVIDPEVAFLLGKDASAFRDTLNGLIVGSEDLRLTAVKDADIKEKLNELSGVFKAFDANVSDILQNMQNLVNAKAASRAIFDASDPMLASTEKLTENYEKLGSFSGWFAVVFGVFALVSAVFLAWSFINDARQRAVRSEEENKRNQEAILRLLNEMGDLAEGDLTVKASVTEDITGAIADSINYTIDELRILVAEINKATEQVTTASQQAQAITAQLLDAAQRQSKEIEETSASVLKMAGSINDVSATAVESARVAQMSLDAAEKGQSAVQDSITGMNEIREQIQETAKRIKRLGESSQEISEIVELISDITEQTNILALNAAIQAASAGEAGRGFTVVAEEVQRLAERSGEATKQIGAIVKTIQTDTHDAVAAMEKSTQGVVEGAKLSDAAGQALSEIGRVSQELAGLIHSISETTQAQTEVAQSVAKNMQDIQNITTQTTEGTKRTAVSIGQLANLAADLKGSVAGFKLS
ncbi:MAG: type IV pili methyl-accepting chemotaxis transducer N-terminal domain-containing protein [Hydrogenophilales bacterium]|nr:type IV pili methyl-accepting chemotaxis transducer N-terminal domain-containing protein [Hydrogenophilales bacterium]